MDIEIQDKRLSIVGDATPSCRHCGTPLTLTLLDLGMSPVANDLIDPERQSAMEPFYPLKIMVCSECRLAQTRDFHSGDDIFREDYVYFSSFSTSWLDHAKRYVDGMVERFGLGPESTVIEIASNDGYLLQFVKEKGIKAVGVEPCRSVAEAAQQKGIDTRIAFVGKSFGESMAAEGLKADLIPANNVFAHVPDINDFVAGAAAMLKPEGVATFEVQHLLRLMQRNQFDTMYHEHFSYLSLIAAQRIFKHSGLRVFDVEELPTHGGSIRFFVCHDGASHAETPNVARVLNEERAYGMHEDDVYRAWQEQVRETKRAFLSLLIDLKRQGKTIVGYGAPAKGNTLLNYCGIGTDFLEFTTDLAPAKQGKLLPGSHIPIRAPEAIFEAKPDYVVILPWNLKEEIKEQMAGIREWGGQFVIPSRTPSIEP